jgi:hypothetical protein
MRREKEWKEAERKDPLWTIGAVVQHLRCRFPDVTRRASSVMGRRRV